MRRQHLGFTLVELLVVMAIIAILVGLILPAVQLVRHAAALKVCQNQLRQIALASHNYHSAYQSLPPGMSFRNGQDPFPFMSWAARLLPFIEQGSVWETTVAAYAREKDFRVSPPHTPLQLNIKIYLCPLETRRNVGQSASALGPAFASYLGVSGAKSRKDWDGVFYLDSHTRLTDVTDGTSNTLLFGERPPSGLGDLGWWYAGGGQGQDGSGDSVLSVRETNYYANAGGCPRGPYQFQPGEITSQCDGFHFWSQHSGGANFAFCDGSVRLLKYEADSVLSALATRAGGEGVDVP